MRAPEVITVRFETEPIKARPLYPPKPVGVAIKEPGKAPHYMAWGHPEGNNCSKSDAQRILKKIWAANVGKLFHNEKFDIDVAETHMGMPRLKWDKYHDTMFLAFLEDPDRPNVKLKDVAEQVLGIMPKERDALREWILQHIESSKKSDWGKYISLAPAGLVGKYAAQGDAAMTEKLFRNLYPKVTSREMLSAYDRERRIMLPLLDSERRGICIDYKRLQKELPFYERLLEEADAKLRKILKSPDLDLDKRGTQLADALDAAGVMDSWQVSEKGNRLTNKKALSTGLNNKSVAALLQYRNALATSIRTFMRPWLITAEQTGGLIHCQWNTVRQAGGGDPFGARTGRISSSPNFQNLPIFTRSTLILPNLVMARIEPVFAAVLKDFPWAAKEKFAFENPGKGMVNLAHSSPLPMMKSFILPREKGHILIERDYSQQELRIMAHYEDDQLLAEYGRNPKMDVHDTAGKLILNMTGLSLARRIIKDISFSILYGMGLAELARKTSQDLEHAKLFKKAYLDAMPGFKALLDGIKENARNNEPIVTWGGRQYFCEKPRVVKGRLRQFEYKLINRLIQGSAADATKESIARYGELTDAERCGGLFQMTVHDSTVISAPKKTWRQADEALRRTMESIELDVPLLTDLKFGTTLGGMK